MSNHLGSTANIFPLTGAIRTPIAQQITDAYGVPVTLQGAVDPQRSRTSFIGRDVDKESDLGAFGARLYSSEYGRFMAVDKLASSFPTISVFVYGMNSPTAYTNQRGLWVIATQPQAQDAITYSVPLKMQEYIVFGQDGTLDAERLKEGIRATGNTTLFVRILDAMASDVETITVSMVNRGESLPIMHPNGSNVDGMTLVGEKLNVVTLPPRRMYEALGKTNEAASRSGSMAIYIRIKNDAGHHPRHATAFIHELGAHADLILQAYRDPALPRQQGFHRYNPDKTVDSNIVLVNRLKNLRVL